MEDYIQFSAKTKSEAITKACIELGVSSDQLEIQVISEGSNGFFGIGSKPAVIKVRKIEPVSEEEEMKEIVETVKLDSFKEEAPVQEEKKELHVAVVTEETQKICEKFLQEVLQAMGMGEVNIVSSIDEEGALAIEMSGENMGILIGKRGQTLDSLQPHQPCS